MKSISALWKNYSFTILLLFVLAGLFNFKIGLIAIVCMLGPILLSLFKGRYWCGNICPRGNFYDKIVRKFSNTRKVPSFFRSISFRICITFMMLTMFTMGMINTWGNLYDMGFIFYRLIVVTTIIGIILSLVFNHRTWCSFCPMGSIAAFVSRFKNKKNSNHLLQVQSNCVSCKICEKKCPMDIKPHEYKGSSITHRDCIQCSQCVYSCPKSSIVTFEEIA